MNRNKTLFLVQMAMFTAIELLFCLTILGSLPLGPIVATLAHIPVLVAALTLGKKAGAFMGAVMGISSLIWWTFIAPGIPTAAPVAFAFTPFAPNGNFWSLLICIVPRFVFPIFAAWLFEIIRKRRGLVLSASVAAGAGTLLHSLLVLSAIYIVFHGDAAVGGSYTDFIVAWGGLNAVMEIVVAVIVGGAVIVPLSKVNKNRIEPAQQS